MEVLPNELVCECLLRVPYTSHDDLKAVCRSWEAMVGSPRFYAERSISGKSEHLICFIQQHSMAAGDNLVITIYDPFNDTWKMLPPIDDPHFPGISILSQCIAVKRKLVLINGEMNSVYIYDFELSRWSRGADMPTPRSVFACCVSSSNGLVYVAGGVDERYNPPAAAKAYNVEEDTWEILPPMIQQHGQGWQGVFMEGKFMVLGGGQFDRSGEVFDPLAGTWRRWEGIWNIPNLIWSPCVASSSGNLYVLINGQDVMKYDRENNVWTHLASLPQRKYVLASVTQCRDWIFVSTSDFASKKHISYLFNPSTSRWIEVNSDEEGFVGMILSATTVEI